MGCVAVVRRRELVSADHLTNSHIQRTDAIWSYGDGADGSRSASVKSIEDCSGAWRVECAPAGSNQNRPVPFLPVNMAGNCVTGVKPKDTVNRAVRVRRTSDAHRENSDSGIGTNDVRAVEGCHRIVGVAAIHRGQRVRAAQIAVACWYGALRGGGRSSTGRECPQSIPSWLCYRCRTSPGPWAFFLRLGVNVAVIVNPLPDNARLGSRHAAFPSSVAR